MPKNLMNGMFFIFWDKHYLLCGRIIFKNYNDYIQSYLIIIRLYKYLEYFLNVTFVVVVN